MHTILNENKMESFIRTTIAITIISCALIITDAFAQNNSFSGTWNRNNEKTDAGGLSINSVSQTLEISQVNGSLTIKGTNKNGNGEISTYTDNLKPGGEPTERAAGADQKKIMTASWSADKKELTETAVYKDKDGNVNNSFKAVYSLSEDGQILTVKDERTFNGRTYQLTDVYDKQ